MESLSLSLSLSLLSLISSGLLSQQTHTISSSSLLFFINFSLLLTFDLLYLPCFVNTGTFVGVGEDAVEAPLQFNSLASPVSLSLCECDQLVCQ